MHGDPVQIVGVVGGRRRTEARVSDEPIIFERADEFVVRTTGDHVIEQFRGNRNLVWREDASVTDNSLECLAMRSEQRTEAHAKRDAQRCRPAKSASSGAGAATAGTGIPESFRASAQPSGCIVHSRPRLMPSSQIWRISAPYSIPATRAMPARPASGAMSGFALTS